MKKLHEFFLKKFEQHKAVLLPIFRFLVLTLAHRHPFWVYLLAVAEGSLKRHQEALPLVESALSQVPPDSPRKRFQWLVRLHRCHDRLGYPDKAADDLRQALRLYPRHFRTHQLLSNLLKRRGPAWQWLDTVRAWMDAYPDRAWLWAEFGMALSRMNRFGEATEAYEKALALEPGNKKQAEWLYQAGMAYERNGQTVEANIKFVHALKLTIPQADWFLGIGILHARQKNWAAAAKAYQATLAGADAPRRLRLHLGEALCNRLRWAEAAEAYGPVLDQLSSDIPPKHYRLYAIALERAGKPEEAVKAYRYLIQTTSWKDPLYRLGCVLHDLGRPKEAVNAFLNSLDEASTQLEIMVPPALEADLAEDQTKAKSHYMLGCQYEIMCDWPNAAEAYQKAADRQEKHNSTVYYRLGFALSRLGHYDEAATAFRDIRYMYKTATLAKGAKEEFFDRTMAYLAAWEHCPLRDEVILYESFEGRTMGDNPYALFLHLLDHPDYADRLHAWALNDKEAMPPEYRKRPNVIFVRRGSDLYWRYLATAGQLVNNATFMPEFIRRPGQKYLNTWHGTPLKMMGKDIASETLPHANVARNFLQATHLINPNQHTKDILLKTAEVDEIISARELISGYPRIDLMINATEGKKQELRRQIGLEDNQPVVLYAPTWRGETWLSKDIDLQQVRNVKAALTGLESQIVFRGHYALQKLVGREDLPFKTAGANIDATELLAITDILITDYSSIFFDFLPARKPILFYAYDLEEYCAQRGGLYFNLEDMPGPVCRTGEELKSALERALREEYTPDQKHLDALARFCPFEDGRASERVADFFFKDGRAEVPALQSDSRRRVLIFPGAFIPNGITASFLNLSRTLDREKYCLTLTLDDAGRHLEKYPDRWAKFEEFDRAGAQLVIRRGRRLFSLEEKLAEDLVAQEPQHALEPEIQEVRRQNHAREFRRVFGDARFDVLVNFEGYSEFWALLLGHAAFPASRAVYLHSAMHEEWKTRFPQLGKVFQAYRAYDFLVSVSPVVEEENRRHLAALYDLAPEKFVAARNFIDEADVLAKAAMPLPDDLTEFIDAAAPCFLALGRLSQEKDYEKLIRAFASVSGDYPQAKLLILGKGYLEPFLSNLIEELALTGRVRLGGFRENPYPLLRRADCFVQSSNYEGQPIVFLEAMVLQRPIISTDLPSSRYALEDNYGLLVENSQAGLEAGLRQFLKQGLPVGHFDAAAYNHQCLEAFERLVNYDG